MNRSIARIGAAIVTVTVCLFALFLIRNTPTAAYLVCMVLPLGYIMLAAGFRCECGGDRRAPAIVGLLFAAIYAALVLTVYFAQTTSVRLEALGEEALRILDYRRGGLFFNLDLLGYGMMALSTFFLGLAFRPETGADRWLRGLMLLHGLFFIACINLPMTGVFTGMAAGEPDRGGTIALLCWCAYFLPIGVLSYLHFLKPCASE